MSQYPHLSYMQKNQDKDFVIVCEGGTDMFKGHPTLHKRAYDLGTKTCLTML